MKSILIVFILVAGLLASRDNELVDRCKMNLSTPSAQPNTIVTNAKLHNCSEAIIFWNYPINNLTMFFTVPQSKPFQLCLTDLKKIPFDLPIYRKSPISGQETKIGTSKSKVCMQSDSTNSLTLKLVGPPKMKYYGVSVVYSITV